MSTFSKHLYDINQQHDIESINYNSKVLNSVLTICNPLFECHISMFEYMCYYKDGTSIYLSTYSKWHKHYIENYARSLLIIDHIKDVFKNKMKYYMWDTCPDLPEEKTLAQYIEDRRAFNIMYDYTIYLHYSDSIESFGFSTTKDHRELVNYYINQQDDLHRFIFYFQDRASEIVNIANAKRIIITSSNDLFLKRNSDTSQSNENTQNFRERVKIKKFRLDTPKGPIFLTRRETQCLGYFSKGKTYKEIAKLIEKTSVLNFSPRTVETHLKNIRNKAYGLGPSQLIDLFLSAPLSNLSLGDL